MIVGNSGQKQLFAVLIRGCFFFCFMKYAYEMKFLVVG